MKLELPPTICSHQDVSVLLQEIRNYAGWFRQNSIRKRFKSGSKNDEPELSPAAREVLRDWSVKKPLTIASLEELIAALQNFSSITPELTITLAAPATAPIKKSLVAWCRKNIAGDILVNFEFNSTILGGMVLRYRSRVFDWSFRRQILDNRQKFSEALTNV